MESIGREDLDVIVVGAGNAATCAALSAQEGGARVVMLEIAPEEARGGNSAFTGGAFRVVYHGGEDLARLIPDMNETELRDVDFGTYTEEQYFDDMGRLTQYRCDPDMTEILIRSSFETGVWMRREGGALSVGARPPGVPGRRQVQVLGRARLPHLGRRQGADEGLAHKGRP
jgi:succinate dehydrogenase/fumarate reductase flavoprotein subunit